MTDTTTPPSKGTITITHTRADGTLVDGSRKGDGVYELIRPFSFTFFRSLDCLGMRQSRDRAAKRWNINAAKAVLEAAGWTVVVTIDEDTRRSFAEAEADREERAEGRAERFADRAERASGASDAAYNAAHRISDGIPMGQPILVGHHSERRARRDVERMHNGMRKGIEEGKRADHWAGRAEAAEHYTAYRNNPSRTLRRIEKLEADARRVEKWLKGQSAGGFTRDISNPDTVAELNRRQAELAEELEHWRGIVAKAEADGFKVWGKSDFVKGDFARIRGHWYEVLRVNVKTLTVPGGPDIQPVISQETRAYSWNDTMPYDGVAGRMSAEEMKAKLAAVAEQAGGASES